MKEFDLIADDGVECRVDVGLEMANVVSLQHATSCALGRFDRRPRWGGLVVGGDLHENGNVDVA